MGNPNNDVLSDRGKLKFDKVWMLEREEGQDKQHDILVDSDFLLRHFIIRIMMFHHKNGMLRWPSEQYYATWEESTISIENATKPRAGGGGLLRVSPPFPDSGDNEGSHSRNTD